MRTLNLIKLIYNIKIVYYFYKDFRKIKHKYYMEHIVQKNYNPKLESP